MKRALNITRLHFTKLGVVLGTPVGILALVILCVGLISLILHRSGMDTTSPEWNEGFSNNASVLWSFPGFFVYLGVQAVSTTFPFGMALGTTRKSYATGTAMFFVAQAAYTAVLGLTLLGVERLTNGWFTNSHVFDVSFLGSGDPVKLILMMFTIALFALSVGGIFGALFVKLGPKGPLALGAALVIILGIILAIFAPQLGSIVTSMTIVKAAASLIVLSLLAIFGQYVALRSASVR